MFGTADAGLSVKREEKKFVTKISTGGCPANNSTFYKNRKNVFRANFIEQCLF